MEKNVWYRAVGFGCSAPKTVSTDRNVVVGVLHRACQKDGSGYMHANTRIYGYATRAKALDGAISDSPGERGRVE